MKVYKLWDPIDRKVIVTCDVVSNEHDLLKKGENSNAPRIDKEKKFHSRMLF